MLARREPPPAEPGADAALLAEIAQRPARRCAPPGPLARRRCRRCRAQPARRRRRRAFAAACHAATGGNPLLLNELLKALDDRGRPRRRPTTSASSASSARAPPRAPCSLRLARLPAPLWRSRGRSPCSATAPTSPRVAALAGLDEPAAAEASAQLARAEILRPEAPLGFVHPLVAGAVYHDLPPGERELAARAGGRLLATPARRPSRSPRTCSRSPAGGEGRVADAAAPPPGRRRARRRRQRRRLPARALEEPPRRSDAHDVLYDLGLREMDLRGDEAAVHLREAYELLTEPGEPRLGRIRAGPNPDVHPARGWRRRRWRATPARELPPRASPTSPDALEAIELETIFFGRPEVEDLQRTRNATARGSRGNGAGRQDADRPSPPTPGRTPTADAERCAELASGSAGGREILLRGQTTASSG